MSSKLFANFPFSLSKFLNKDYSGTITQETLDNLNEQSSVEELDSWDEIKTPYKVNLFEVAYGRVEKNISRLKSTRNKYKVQIQYNYEQHKEYLGYSKLVDSSSFPPVYKSNTLRDAITVRNKIRKTLPGRITVHSNGVRKIENTYKDSVKSSKSTISASLPVGVNFNNTAVDKYGRKFSYFWALFKNPEGKFKSKSFSVGGHLDIRDPVLIRAKELATAVRNEYEWHLVNSVPYYINSDKFKGWQKMSEFEFIQLIDIRMKKLV